MLIRVFYNDNRYDYVKDVRLDEFIESGKILKFQRNDGWVTIGVDPIRKKKITTSYPGPERRRYQPFAGSLR